MSKHAEYIQAAVDMYREYEDTDHRDEALEHLREVVEFVKRATSKERTK